MSPTPQQQAPLPANPGWKIAVAADHAGFELKCLICKHLENLGVDVDDLGAHREDPLDDYPDFAERVGEWFGSSVESSGKARENAGPPERRRAVVICGSGVGVCVALNKFPGLRAAICHDAYSAGQGVEHDNMNVLCLGSRIVGVELARTLVTAFLSTAFSAEERHVRRLAKVAAIERRFTRQP